MAFGRSYNKYGNKKVEMDGIKFDSKVERDYFIYLKDKKARGEITDIEVHKKFLLQDKFEQHGKKYRAIHYEADFVITYNTGKQEAIDTKGAILTSEFILKAKIYRKLYGDEIPLRVIAYRHGEWIDFEEYLEELKKTKKKNKK